MKISKIKIKNFRSFDEEQIINFYDLQKPITIIGENNSWKSNIIKSILYGLGHKYIWEDGITEFDFYNQITTTPIEIDIILDDQRVIKFRTNSEIQDPPSLTIDWWYYWKSKKSPIVDKIFFYDFQQIANLLKVKTDFTYTPLGKVVKWIKEKFRRDTTLRNELNNKIRMFINQHIASDADYQNFQRRVGEKLKQNIRNHSEEFEFAHTIQDVDKIINWLSFFIKENSEKPLISVENFWSWFRSLLVFSIFEAISESGSWWNIFIFEEPETFLHENYEEYFFALLQKLSINNQVILTTHSKKFVDIFNVGTVIRLRNNKDTNFKTKVHQQNLNQDIIDNINQKVLRNDSSDDLTQEESQLILFPDDYWSYMKAIEPNIWLVAFSEKVIIVEWPHDLLAYKLAFEKKMEADGYQTPSLGYIGINIICVHNKDLIWPLMYICNRLWTKAFIIFDSDLHVEQEIDVNDNYLANELDFWYSDYRQKDPYLSLDSKWKQHYTKTIKLISIAKKFWFPYQINKPKIEWVLDYERDDNYEERLTYKNKSTLTIFRKLKDKEYQEIRQEYPDFITNELDGFITV